MSLSLNYDEEIIYRRLVPGYLEKDDAGKPPWKWTIEKRPPGEKECEIEWKIYLNELKNKQKLKEAKLALQQGIDDGYTDSDGNVYPVDDTQIEKLAQTITLATKLDEDIIPVQKLNGKIVTKTFKDYKLLAKNIGQYNWNLKINVRNAEADLQ